jgi:DNA-binding response OmpR family regulator
MTFVRTNRRDLDRACDAERTTILLLEDEPMLRELVAEMLTAVGYRVLAAADGNAAERISGRHKGPIHLLLSDMMLPGRNGEEVAFRLASMRPEARLLYMSAFPVDRLRNRDSQTMFLAKPFGRDSLLQAVASGLRW